MRGYYGIGIYNTKKHQNLGTLWRSSYIQGADFIFTIGRRYKHQTSDTIKAFRHIPLLEYVGWDDFISHIPHACEPICVEICDKAIPLKDFQHPQRAIYILGSEDSGIPTHILDKYRTVQIPSVRDYCHNVAVAGAIVIQDRIIKA